MQNYYFKKALTECNKIFFFGFSLSKYIQLKKFFHDSGKRKLFRCKSVCEALKNNIDNRSIIVVWGLKQFHDVEIYAHGNNIELYRVEDGFLRSFASNSAYPRIYSIVIDSRGIYFDPNKESDLEFILNNYSFDQNLIDRSKELIDKLVRTKVTKYNHQQESELNIDKRTHDKIILVVGQIEDGWSVLVGGCGITMLDMVKRIRENNNKAYIIYKIPPDILSIKKRLSELHASLSPYVNQFVYNASILSCIYAADEVHTLTSLAGFEALIRDKKVHTYGIPFYAGWGLTIDINSSERRKRTLTIEELVAGAVILYPLYKSGIRESFCSADAVIDELYEKRSTYNKRGIYHIFTKMRMHIIPKLPFYKL